MNINRRPITRRTACRILAGTAAGAFAAPLSAAEDRFRFNYITGSSLYGRLKLDVILPEIPKTGTEWLDIWPMGHADQREQVEEMGHDAFRAMLKKYGVKLGISTCYNLGPFGLQTEMEFVHDFGGRLLICASGGPKNVKGAEYKAAVAQFVEQMKPHTARAEELGLVIGIENHGHALINTVESIEYFGELAKSPALGIALAPYHLPQDPKVIARVIEDLGPKLAHFYAWEHGQGAMKKLPKAQEMEQMPGFGKLDFGPIVGALKKINYDRWTEVFMHPVPRGIPILPTAEEVTAAINKSRKYLEQLT